MCQRYHCLPAQLLDDPYVARIVRILDVAQEAEGRSEKPQAVETESNMMEQSLGSLSVAHG